ncbi:hypothetical protein BZG36_04767 [Bifiguratus adelaidae]|uniref:GATA-type domain-containing protein n=1 Tax=Bifiguratus adelaidae TaxID=1938954 RepID=A0A261XVN2_9FUNG|nr:hypothetical protein BZG36_04767 [Bifiguratus adelaidae]
MSALPKPELMYNNDENMRDHQFSNDNSDSTSPGPRELVKEWYPFTYDLGTDVQDRYRHAETDYSGPASNESYGAAAFQPSDHVQPSMARRYSTESYLSHELASDGMSHDSTNLPLRNYNHTYQEHVPASSHNGSMWNNGARAIYDGRFDCVADRYGYMPLTQPYAAYQSHVSAPYLVPGARGRSMSYLPSLAMQLPDPAYRSDLSGPPDYSFHLGSSEQLKRASSSSSSSTTRRHNSTSSSEQAPKKICSNCRTDQTPSWRRDSEGKELLCNACGL